MILHKIVNGVQVPLSPEEIAEFKAREAEHEANRGKRKLADIRAKRNALLAATDVKMLPDYPGDKQAVIAYRQALRDVTKQPDLDNIVWPKGGINVMGTNSKSCRHYIALRDMDRKEDAKHV